MEGVFDIRSTPLLLGDRVDTGGTTKHGKWSYGSAQVIGMHIRILVTDRDVKLDSQALLWLFSLHGTRKIANEAHHYFVDKNSWW